MQILETTVNPLISQIVNELSSKSTRRMYTLLILYATYKICTRSDVHEYMSNILSYIQGKQDVANVTIYFNEYGVTVKAAAIINYLCKKGSPKKMQKIMVSRHQALTDMCKGMDNRDDLFAPINTSVKIDDMTFYISCKKDSKKDDEQGKFGYGSVYDQIYKVNQYVITITSRKMSCAEILKKIDEFTRVYLEDRENLNKRTCSKLMYMRYVSNVSNMSRCQKISYEYGNGIHGSGMSEHQMMPTNPVNFTIPRIFKDIGNPAILPTPTFDTLFFTEKSRLIKIFERFNDVSWHMKRGIPRTIGLLFHGPSGTGKSKTVCALAAHLHRHIIEISLSELRTAKDIIQIIEDINNIGYINTSNSIFVFDEFDKNYSSVIKDDSFSRKMSRYDTRDLAVERSPMGMSEDYQHQPLARRLVEPEIDIGMLLSLFDGVVNKDGMIIIVVANDLSKINPGLYRDGRLTPIQFTKASKEDVQNILQNFYKSPLSVEQISLLPDSVVSHSTVVARCLQTDDVNEVIGELSKMIDSAI